MPPFNPVDFVAGLSGTAQSAMGKFIDTAAEAASMQGGDAAAHVVRETGVILLELNNSILQQVHEGLGEALHQLGESTLSGLETVLSQVIAILSPSGPLSPDVLERLLEGALAAWEAYKKMLFLIFDYLKAPLLTDPIAMQLDLMNNVLGNVAHMISPTLGAAADRLRDGLYFSLKLIREARGELDRFDEVEGAPKGAG